MIKKYTVEFFDPSTRATSPIDTIEEPAGYTAEQYIADCMDNADADYREMLQSGTVTLIEIED